MVSLSPLKRFLIVRIRKSDVISTVPFLPFSLIVYMPQVFQRMRRENDAVDGEAIAKLEDIATTVHEIDDQLDNMAEWQEKHQEIHDRVARRPR